MKIRSKFAEIVCLCALAAFPIAGYSQLAVNVSTNASAMADSLASASVSVSNASFTGNANSGGHFSNGQTTNLGMQSGIVLSTGKCNESGFKASSLGSTNLGNGGYSLLSTLSSLNTFDAAVIELDATPQFDTLGLEFIFASEDYPENVGMTYFDPFGIFVSGKNPKGGTYTDQNFALIPNTSKIISINTINDTTNWQYYTSNVTGATILFDGFTKVMSVKIPVSPGNTYRLKIGIADGGDYIYDSGIFLKKHSLISYGPTSSDHDLRKPAELKLVGNPLQDNSYLQYKSAKNTTGIIKIYDVKGARVGELQALFEANKNQQIPLGNLNLKPGLYTLQFAVEGQSSQLRLVVP